MSSSQRSPNPRAPDGAVEPFPTFSSPQDHTNSNTNTNSITHTSTSATTTTTTVIGGRNPPTTTTTVHGPGPIRAPGPVHPPAPVHSYSATPSSSTYVAPVVTTTSNHNVAPYPRTEVTAPVVIRRRPIGIRRLPSSANRLSDGTDGDVASRSGSTRGRSSSDPQQPHLTSSTVAAQRLTRQGTRPGPADLPTLREESTQPQQLPPVDFNHLSVPGQDGVVVAQPTTSGGRRRSLSNAARSVASRLSSEGHPDYPPPHEYETEVVDLLDVIDPEVSTLTTLTNVQNSLFVPDLGRWINRRPTYTLSRAPTRTRQDPAPDLTPMVTAVEKMDDEHHDQPSNAPPGTPMQRTWSWQRRPPAQRSHSISSEVTDSHFAVLPHGVTLDDWSEEDKEALDDHVRHMLHSKRSKFKQSMKAFGKYISTPLGFFVTTYATLITVFGLVWVLFLIGWIYGGSKNNYVINVVDNVLVALFAVMGDGLAPFRIVDTYHMIYIVHYHNLAWKLREKKAMPKLTDHNDLPDTQRNIEKIADPEAQEETVLTPVQQKRLIHHQTKFAKSHTYYKPHETVTHHAFPIKLLVTCVVLLDCHSIFQVMLGTFTWAWSYHTRPAWITSVILSCSITVNITAGVLISIGDKRTRKKDVVMRMTRQELTSEAIKKVKKRKTDRDVTIDHEQDDENLETIRENPRDTSQTGESFRTA